MCIYIIHIVHTHTRIYSYIPIHMRDRGRKSLQVLNCSETWRLCREKLRLCDIKWETTRHFHFSCHSPFLGIFFHFISFCLLFFLLEQAPLLFFICFEWMRSYSLLFSFFLLLLDETMHERRRNRKVGLCRFVAKIKWSLIDPTLRSRIERRVASSS